VTGGMNRYSVRMCLRSIRGLPLQGRALGGVCPATRLATAGEAENGGPPRLVVSADLRVWNGEGALVARLDGLALRRAGREVLLRGLPEQAGGSLYELAWGPQPAVPTGEAAAAGPGRGRAYGTPRTGARRGSARPPS
jgi:hypothetical protein